MFFTTVIVNEDLSVKSKFLSTLGKTPTNEVTYLKFNIL